MPPGRFEIQDNGRMANPCIRSCLSWCKEALRFIEVTPRFGNLTCRTFSKHLIIRAFSKFCIGSSRRGHVVTEAAPDAAEERREPQKRGV